MEEQGNNHHGHDTHATPPQKMFDLYKEYQRLDDASVEGDMRVVDFGRGLSLEQKEKIVAVGSISSDTIAAAQKAFRESNQNSTWGAVKVELPPDACTIYEHRDFGGLRIFPSLLPSECQYLMLSSILHRDLSNPLHKTNLHHDYDIPYPPPEANADSTHPASFFTYPQHSKHQVFTPLNPHSTNKLLNTTQVLHKRLRWLTLGSQYDWATRAYPATSPTPFPPDIAGLVQTLFNHAFIPESGVVLLYSSKDYMPVHRDVSEECQRGLASFTLGCDGLFMIAKDKEGENPDDEEREQEVVVLRVRSGDVVQMGGETRWAWHAMPKIMANTTPKELEDWPVGVGTPKEFEKWKGYMRGKRLNISCRQVWGE